jgi:hypothetical protein
MTFSYQAFRAKLQALHAPVAAFPPLAPDRGLGGCNSHGLEGLAVLR